MWTSALAFLGRFTGGGWTTPLLVILIVSSACAGLLWAQGQQVRIARLRQDLMTEYAAHKATSAELAAAKKEIAALTALLDRERSGQSALRESLVAALERESLAVSQAAARKKILDGIRTMQRPENAEVVDDATRAAVADRLNRAL